MMLSPVIIRKDATTEATANLRRAFNVATLQILTPAEGKVFGVLDWELDGKVPDHIVEQAREELSKQGFDDPVIALPYSRNAHTLIWKKPEEFTLIFDMMP